MKLFASVVLALAMSGLAACNESEHTYRYRLTLTAETGGQTVSGSSVIQVSEGLLPDYWPNAGGRTTRIEGDATAVDLGGGRILIGTLQYPQNVEGFDEFGNTEHSPTRVLLQLHGLNERGDDHPKRKVGELVRSRGSFELNADQLPILLLVEDRLNPLSARMIEVERLPAPIAPDVELVGARVTMTRDPVRRTLSRTLPWVSEKSTVFQTPGFCGVDRPCISKKDYTRDR